MEFMKGFDGKRERGVAIAEDEVGWILAEDGETKRSYLYATRLRAQVRKEEGRRV